MKVYKIFFESSYGCFGNLPYLKSITVIAENEKQALKCVKNNFSSKEILEVKLLCNEIKNGIVIDKDISSDCY